jgi:transposase
MTTDLRAQDRIEMSRKERDVLTVLRLVLAGQRTQAEAARLLGLSARQVRRLQRRLQAEGDAGLVHRLRGRPSNRRLDPGLRRRALAAFRRRCRDFGPTLASEKLAELGLPVSADTLRRWLLQEGLWQRRRRPRRACFGELVQMDASVHDWTEGRGAPMVLVTMIDDATGRLEAGFFAAGTVEAHLELLGRWLLKYGRPVALYTDRHSIFEPQEKGQALADGLTQFGRALQELGIELIRANSPQAKGRVERSFGTAQDRWVKEMRLAGVRALAQANALLRGRLLPEHNRRFTVAPQQPRDAHRPLGPRHNLAAILSIQQWPVVSNDYVVRFQNRFYQLHKPVWPGQRGGRVVIELRLDGTMAIRFKGHYLNFEEIAAGRRPGGRASRPPEFSALAADASGGAEAGRAPGEGAAAPRVQPAGGRSGRTPAQPYPPDGGAEDTKKGSRRPAADHPWRRGFNR